MKMKNIELESFINFLDTLKLVDRASRMRTRLKRKLVEKHKLFEEERMEIANQYAKKQENGESVIENRDGQNVIVIDDIESANKAFTELFLEDVVIEENEENKNMLLSVKDSVLNCGFVFEGDQADAYCRWCEILEDVYGVGE